MYPYRFLIVLCLFVFLFERMTLSAQTNKFKFPDNENWQVNKLKRTGDNLLILGFNGAARINLLTQNFESLKREDESHDTPQIFAENSNGFFFCCVINDEYHLRFFSANDNFVSKPLGSSSGTLSNCCIVNDRFYFAISRPNGAQVWESDGTDQGTKVVHEATTSIFSLIEFGKKLAFGVRMVNAYGITTMAPGSAATLICNVSGPFYLHTSNDSTNIYFSRTDTVAVWRTNGVSSYKINNYKFDGDVKRKGQNIYLVGVGVGSTNVGNWIFTKYSLTDPSVNFSLPWKNDNTFTRLLVPVVADRFFFTYSIKEGVEPAIVDFEKDTLRQIADLNPGASSSYAYPLVFGEDISSKVCAYKNDYYFPGTNGLNNHRYLYRTDGNSCTSLFSIGQISDLKRLLIADETAHWVLRDAYNRTTVFWRSLSSTDPPQTAQESESWNRQVSVLRINIGGSSAVLRNVQTDADKEGAVIACAQIDPSNGHLFAASATTVNQVPSATSYFVKYDRFGNFQWMNTIGQTSRLGTYPLPVFCIDTAGDILTCGKFFQEGIFDEDTVKNYNYGGNYYLAKLSGKTGKVMWKNIFNAPNNGIEYMIPDKLECDDDNSVYLSFMYFGNIFNIEGISVTSTISPVNALARFTDGNLSWVINIQTPWTDYYGRTHSMTFDPATKDIVVTQSQRHYNTWTSCKFGTWGNFIQQVDQDGNIIGAKEIRTDDISSITAAVAVNGKIMMHGYYRDKITADSFTAETAMDQDCKKIENFRTLFGPGPRSFTALLSSDNGLFYPFDAAADAHNVYVIGAAPINNANNLVIKKYDLNGKLLARRVFSHWVSGGFSDFDIYYTISVSGDHLVISGENKSDRFDTIVSSLICADNFGGFTIWKFNKTEGWETDLEPEPAVELIATDEEMLLYPNPVSGTLFFQLKAPADFNELEIINALGVTVGSYALEKNHHSKIDISVLPPGPYILKIKGPERKIVRKIICH